MLTVVGVAVVLITILATRVPIEKFPILGGVISAHSFSYNRLGLALILVPTLLVLLPRISIRNMELLAGSAAGIALVLALLTKWSFAPVLPALAMALLVQRRWAALASMFASLVVVGMLLDPLAERWIGTTRYFFNLAQAAQGTAESFGALPGLIMKTLRLALAGLVSVLAAIAAMLAACKLHTSPLRWIGAAVLMVGGAASTLVAMGDLTMVGHQVIPLTAVVMLACYEQFRWKQVAGVVAYRVFAIVLVLAFLLPHLLNSVLLTAVAYEKRQEPLISEGPMAGYLADYATSVPDASPAGIIEKAAAEFREQGALSDQVEYLAFVNGIQALRRLGDLSDRGVISGSLLGFEYASGSKPVAAYPLWPRLSSPEFAELDHLPDDVDVVLLLRTETDPLGELLLSMMAANFELCLQSGFWDIYLRREGNRNGCELP